MLKIQIRTLMPIRREKKRNYLKPGKYEAVVTLGGGLIVHAEFGEYYVSPGQFETIRAPRELFYFWRCSIQLLEAQAAYNQVNNYATACVLQSAQGKYEAASRKLKRLIEGEVVKS